MMVKVPVEDGFSSVLACSAKKALRWATSSSVPFLLLKTGAITGEPAFIHAALKRGFFDSSAYTLVRFGPSTPPPSSPTPALWQDMQGGAPLANAFWPVKYILPRAPSPVSAGAAASAAGARPGAGPRSAPARAGGEAA